MKLKGHIGYYFSLLAILALGFILTLATADKQEQALVVTLTAFFYVLWGILHHLLHHDLTAKIVVEYVLTGSLGLALVLFILKGGLGF